MEVGKYRLSGRREGRTAFRCKSIFVAPPGAKSEVEAVPSGAAGSGTDPFPRFQTASSHERSGGDLRCVRSRESAQNPPDQRRQEAIPEDEGSFGGPIGNRDEEYT